MGEVERHLHALRRDPAPALREVPEEREQPPVDAREAGDGLGDRHPLHLVGEAVDDRRVHLGVAAERGAEARVEHRDLRRREHRPAPLRAQQLAGIVGLPRARDVALAAAGGWRPCPPSTVSCASRPSSTSRPRWPPLTRASCGSAHGPAGTAWRRAMSMCRASATRSGGSSRPRSGSASSSGIDVGACRGTRGFLRSREGQASPRPWQPRRHVSRMTCRTRRCRRSGKPQYGAGRGAPRVGFISLTASARPGADMGRTGRMPERHPHMPAPAMALPEQPGEALTAVDMSAEADIERRAGQRAQISNAMVALKKRFYGKGPERARSYILDDYIFCAMEGGLTRSEEVLVEAGQEQAVRQYRLLFQEAMTKTVTRGRRADHGPPGARLPQPDHLPADAHVRDLRARALGSRHARRHLVRARPRRRLPQPDRRRSRRLRGVRAVRRAGPRLLRDDGHGARPLVRPPPALARGQGRERAERGPRDQRLDRRPRRDARRRQGRSSSRRRRPCSGWSRGRRS